MIYNIIGNEIIVHNVNDFNAKHILECGQVFRYQQTNDGYKVFSKNLYSLLIIQAKSAIILSTEVDYFVRFFDLDRDYGDIKHKLSGYQNLKSAIEYGNGIRILKQDPIETIFQFILSANNNIPRIRSTIERISTKLGQDMCGYYAFPTLESLCRADVDLFKQAGAGYRAEYISRTARMINDGFSLDVCKMTSEEARAHLMQLPGVGPKVADCVLLFGYGRTDVFPTDVWINRVYCDLYDEHAKTRREASKRLALEFGELSGFVQQYLFYYKRGTISK
ncbi:MAG: 8-oxoguanine DNA glycosylase [Christensenellaceae bacterium]|nr:8-oxoguanine DNA glycosylase [Christensenellaceae bacterium]